MLAGELGVVGCLAKRRPQQGIAAVVVASLRVFCVVAVVVVSWVLVVLGGLRSSAASLRRGCVRLQCWVRGEGPPVRGESGYSAVVDRARQNRSK